MLAVLNTAGLFLVNQGSVPNTLSKGGVIFAQGGALKYKGSSGTTVANT